MLTTDYTQTLRAYLKSIEHSFAVLAVQHIGDGITVIKDSWNEFDTYFDREKWEPTIPEIWEDGLYPPGLEGTGIGVLPGQGRAPGVHSFDEAVIFAKEHLKPRNDTIWFESLPAAQTEL